MRPVLRDRIATAMLALVCGPLAAAPALAWDPDVPEAFDDRLSVHIRSDGIDAAEAELRSRNFEAAVRMATGTLRAGGIAAHRVALGYRVRGIAHLNLRRLERARTDFDAALAIEPHSLVGLVGRATTLIALGRHVDGLAAFDRAVAAHRVAFAYYWRGLARITVRDLPGAVADFSEALALQPRFALAYYGRGLAYHALGRVIHARDDYDHALALDRRLTGARQALAALNARRPAPLPPSAPYGQPARDGIIHF